MLEKPEYGWSNFQLPGTKSYPLSYLDDIAVDWLEETIHGLEVMTPFCVKGFMEPGRVLCLVSYWNCHIICEPDEREPFVPGDVTHEISHTNMLEFCTILCQDIRENLDEWVSFTDYFGDEELFNTKKRKQMMEALLSRLEELIAKRAEDFGGNVTFL